MPPPSRVRRPFDWRAAAVLLALAAVIVAERVHTYQEPFENDVAGYAVTGHEWLRGRPLYAELWDRKPPLLYATYAAAEVVCGYGRGAIFALNVTAALATLGGVYAAGRVGGGPVTGPVAGAVAGGLWAAVGGDLMSQANQPNAEVFINAAMTAAVALLLAWPARRRWPAAVALGGLFAAATLYKHHLVVTCAALAVGHVLGRRAEAGRRAAEMAVAFAVVAVAWAAVLAGFAAVGHLGVVVDVLFHQDAGYAGGLGWNMVASLAPGAVFRPATAWAVGPLVLVGGWLAFAARRGAAGPTPSAWGLWLAWAAGTWPAVALPGQLFPHYYQYWLPVACVAGGWSAAALLAAKPRVPAGLRWGIVGTTLAAVAVRQGWPYVRLTPDGWAAEKYPGGNYVQQKYLGRYLTRTLLRPGERFWVAGDDTSLYFESGQSPVSGLMYVGPLTLGDETAGYNRRLVDDLGRSPPDLVILSPLIERFPADAPVHAWLAAHYVPWVTTLGRPTYRMRVRKGSDLQRRVGAPG